MAGITTRCHQARVVFFSLVIGWFCRVTCVPFYRAAIFEHCDPSDDSMELQDIMLQSAFTYEEQINRAALLKADIIVFPEYGITGLSIPDSRNDLRPFLQVLPSIEPDFPPFIPCLDANSTFNVTILKQLSCAARNNDIVVVANMGTLVPCNDTSCPPDGAYQFNTDVVFGVDGAILATYHKINLYHELTFDKPPFPPGHVTTFQTSFAGTFGVMTCFDLVWYDPLISMVTDAGVKRVVTSSAWVDGLPFLTSVQSQMAWSIGLDIDLIAANVQRSKDGYRGSGIYHGRQGYVAYLYGASNASHLVVADIPLGDNTGTILEPVDLPIAYDGIIYDDLSNYTFMELGDKPSAMAELSTGNLSCRVWYRFEDLVTSGSYFLAGYDGHITLGDGDYRLAIQVCALVWCRNGSTSQCARPPVTSTAQLLNMTLEGNFSTSYIYPSILQHDLMLIDTTEWRFDSEEVIDGELRTASARLTTVDGFRYRPCVASLYGRVYGLDQA